MSKYYDFSQNNSGGKFAMPAIKVYIEANNAEEANEIALSHDIYFDGTDEGGPDCECCGDRWYRVDERDVTEELEISDATKHWSQRSGIPGVLVIKKEKSNE